jgi:hypothetical protein
LARTAKTSTEGSRIDVLGGVAVVAVIVGFVLSLAGLVRITERVRDAGRRAVGMRTCRAGMAMMSIGGILFVLSRPAGLLPAPLSLLVVGVLVVSLVGSLRWPHA